MTNHEAIRLMRNLPTMCVFIDAYGEPIDSDAYYEAVDMAISALQALDEIYAFIMKSEASETTDGVLEIFDALEAQDAPDTNVDTSKYTVRATAVEEMLKDLLPERGMWEIEGDEAKNAVCETVRDALEGLWKLPFAQPEIIHCRDCKHHWTHSSMDAFPREICDLDQTFYDSNFDYCSLAERREDGSD